jgi:hypothetical protein
LIRAHYKHAQIHNEEILRETSLFDKLPVSCENFGHLEFHDRDA